MLNNGARYMLNDGARHMLNNGARYMPNNGVRYMLNNKVRYMPRPSDPKVFFLIVFFFRITKTWFLGSKFFSDPKSFSRIRDPFLGSEILFSDPKKNVLQHIEYLRFLVSIHIIHS